MKKIFLVLLLVFAACEPTYLDEGFMVADEGFELRPGALPRFVSANTPEALPATIHAIAWWNTALGCEALLFDENGNGDITVDVGLVPLDGGDMLQDGEPIGIALVRYDAEGIILGATVTISADIAYDEETVELVAAHEAGHAAFGLSDDPGPPETVDLRSIMASPLDPLGELTAHDRALLEPYLEGLACL
jgi:hypothetical protein